MKNKFWYFVFFIFWVSFVNAQQKHFVLYHLVRYKNTPANLSPYLQPTKIASEHILLNADNTPDVAAIKAFAALCPPGVLTTLDLETWPYYPAEKLSKTIDYFLTALKAFKSVNTQSPVSFYGVPPKQAYQWKSIDPENNPKGYNGWKNISEKLSPVAQNVDAFLPSFYMYNPDTSSWHKMVDSTIAAIKKYHQHKPIYAYIWPQFHNKSAYSLQFIDTAIWKYQLRTLYDRTDGCIIWTSNKDSEGKIIYWDPNMLWWQATKAFMVEKSLVPPLVLDSISIHRSRNKIKVRWTTSVDTISSSFLVQRSMDGVHFQSTGKSNSSMQSYYTQNNYQFDDKISTKKIYYRLEISIKKGGMQYSPVVTLEANESEVNWENNTGMAQGNNY
jgi:hypothetical protein